MSNTSSTFGNLNRPVRSRTSAIRPIAHFKKIVTPMIGAVQMLAARAKRIGTKRIVCAAIGASAALGISREADASIVEITITGTIASGTDVSGVFGFAAGTDLTNKTFTLIYTFDDTKGTPEVMGCETDAQCVSEITGKDPSSPGTATLQINGVTWKFGNLANDTGSSFAKLSEGSGGNYVQYAVIDTVLADGAIVNSNVAGYVYPASGTVLSDTASWESAFSNSTLLSKPSNTQIFGFSIYTDSASSSADATGVLTPTTIAVSGPMNNLDSGKALGGCQCHAGDPITVGTGNLFEEVTDYRTAGQNPLAFTRYYDSMENRGGIETLALGLGVNWRTNYDRYLQLGKSTVLAERPDGQQLTFSLVGGLWKPDTDVDVKLVQAGSIWTLTDHDDTVETYDTQTGSLGTLEISYGQLQSIKSRNGYTQTLVRTTANELIVEDSYGRKLTLAYTGGLLTTVTTPDTLVLTYGFTKVATGYRLNSVSYNTDPVTKQTYVYGNSGFPFALTGITDENGKAFASWIYDSSGRATSSQHGSGADLIKVTYNSDGTTTVTNAFGVQDTYTFSMLQGVPKVTEIGRAATSTTATATRPFDYDGNGYLNNSTDWNGNKTTYINNSHGDATSIVEAVGSPVTRTTKISYDPTWVHEPHQIVTPGLTSTFVYDASGNPHTRTDLDTTTNTVPYSTKGQTRITTWTWSGTGQELSVQLPRTDVVAMTGFTYDGTGALIQSRDALGHLTKVTSHTGGGLPLTIVDPNNVTTTLAYDARLNLHTSILTTIAGKLTTTFNHDAANNLTGVQLPDASELTYGYDTAHRLTGVKDLLGNNITYTLNALGNRTAVTTKNTSAATRKHSASFDALGRTLTDVGGMGQTTKYAYDKNGNVLTVTPPSPSGPVTYTYDALNRRSTAKDPSPGGTTTTTYDTHDRPLTVKDANGNTTAYTFDGFGDRTQTASPDSGTTVYRYDGDRNLTQSVKPGPLTANTKYDALDRRLTTSYPTDATLNLSRTYDQTGHGFGVGRLTSVTDQAGSDAFTYDERGNPTNESRVVTGSGTLKTITSFDKASNVSGITYPSGTVVGYVRDTMGRVTSVTAKLPGASAASNVVTAVAYEPFGPETGLTFGNGIKGAYGYDLDYRPTTRIDTGTSAVQKLTYGYFPNDSVEKITDAVNTANSQTLRYDTLDRLMSATSGKGGYGTQSFTWDAVGNIKTQLASGVTTTFGYASGTNRLATALDTGGMVENVSSTAAGSLSGLTIGSTSVEKASYNQANQLSSVTASSAATYKYDFGGQRLVKALPGSNPILYQYSRIDGALLSENDLHKGQTADYIYLNGRPIGEVNPVTGKLYFTHTDKLGTPQRLTDSTQAVAWSALYQPFGSATFGGILATQSLRFPGQQFDPESGLYHNGFRNYSSELTRYVESDPIGLVGGMNTYAYSGDNPFRWVDPKGTSWIDNTVWFAFGQAEQKALESRTASALQEAFPSLSKSCADFAAVAFYDVLLFGVDVPAAAFSLGFDSGKFLGHLFIPGAD